MKSQNKIKIYYNLIMKEKITKRDYIIHNFLENNNKKNYSIILESIKSLVFYQKKICKFLISNRLIK